MSSTTNYTPPSAPVRRPYRGSCHCGHIRYIVFLTLPPAALGPAVLQNPSVQFYKCNCSTCHKMGIFHIRAPSSPDDFLLLSPLDPKSGLSDYMCAKKRIHWYFCGNCGVRCFALQGEGEVAEVDLEKELGAEKSGGERTKVWRCKKEGWKEGRVEGRTSYLSVNAHTIEPGQEGLDLREIVDKKWVAYLDILNGKDEGSFDYPQRGGTW